MKIDIILKYTSTVFIFFAILSYAPENPKACKASILGNPVGGRVKYYNPLCKLPVPHTNYSTINPGRGTGLWNDIPSGTFHYNYGPVSHPGQPVLGMGSYQYMPCMTPCPGGACKIGPGGYNVEYQGTGVAGAGLSGASGGCVAGVAATAAVGTLIYNEVTGDE